MQTQIQTSKSETIYLKKKMTLTYMGIPKMWNSAAEYFFQIKKFSPMKLFFLKAKRGF